ncbi:MAG: hypothetical protein ACR2PI_00585 [Hyphomicrobiaceae bacterium]
MQPFRWNIARREQLGSLIADIPSRNLNHDGFLSDLRRVAARVLAFGDDADLAFIGRTPENLFDYLSGAFAEIDDAPALHLVQFSLRWAGEAGVRSLAPAQLEGFFAYLTETNLDAATIARAPAALALVDFVAHGGTMQNFVELLELQAERQGADWNAVQRRLRIIGLRVRTHNSPNTWRWQQHQDWLHLVPDTVIKNVSAPGRLLYPIANTQDKVTHAFHPGLWELGDDLNTDLEASNAQRTALGFAVQLYDAGRSRDERDRLAADIASLPEMKQAATRRIVSRLKRGKRVA